YKAFQKLDYKGMINCYSDDVVFFDPVFGLLQADQVKFMWEMLCKNAKDFSVTYTNITHLDDEYSTCDWTATYTFSKTGRKVMNKCKAHMRFANGKIIEHSDGFSVHKWSKQAFGFIGELFGWSTFFQNRIKKQAKVNLNKFMASK
ncbi:MAG: nuclear transport factor 2 family protein, partial [Sphingobacteriales bacterium]|nr:nuclear transport factor 2 family protein [Sphingobacteriales bacterium]